MKKIILLLTAALLSIASVAQANDTQSYFGPTTLSKTTLESTTFHGVTHLDSVKAKNIVVLGGLTFKNLDVSGSADVVGPVSNSQKGNFSTLKITGPFEANDVVCDALQVIGTVQATNLIVKGEAVVYGPLKATKSRFNNMTITAKQVDLNNVEINNIMVRKLAKDDTQEVIYLRGKTTVLGSINFESGNGLIIIQGRDANIKGEIKGGKVENK